MRGLNKHWQGDILSRIKHNTHLFIKKVLLKKKTTRVGSWSNHVDFWGSLDGIAIVRYEDLLIDTENELKKIFDKLNIKVTDKHLKQTIENQSFDKKKKEFIQKGDMVNAKFMRSGKKESWKQLISSVLQSEIEEKHHKTLLKYNYK